MKKLLITFCLPIVGITTLQAQEYKIITVVESIVPGGLGRSRMIENKTDLDIDKFTTERTDGKRGWEFAFVIGGVESDAGGTTDGKGIFITRYIFKK